MMRYKKYSLNVFFFLLFLSIKGKIISIGNPYFFFLQFLPSKLEF